MITIMNINGYKVDCEAYGDCINFVVGESLLQVRMHHGLWGHETWLVQDVVMSRDLGEIRACWTAAVEICEEVLHDLPHHSSGPAEELRGVVGGEIACWEAAYDETCNRCASRHGQHHI